MKCDSVNTGAFAAGKTLVKDVEYTPFTIFDRIAFQRLIRRMARTNPSGKWGGAEIGGHNPSGQNNTASGFNQLGSGPNTSGQVRRMRFHGGTWESEIDLHY